MCSTRCDRPACGSSSVDEPVPTQKPRATDLTESMDSVTIRRPDGSSVRRCSVLATLGVAPRAVARAPGAAAVAVTVAAAAAAVAIALAARTAVASAAGADRGELLHGLPCDLRVLGQAQADAAALAVDLDDPHGHLVAAVEDVLDGVHPLARGDVRDVQEAVGALRELDEGAERRRLDDLAPELVADLDLLRHRADALCERLAQLPVGRLDEDLP